MTHWFKRAVCMPSNVEKVYYIKWHAVCGSQLLLEYSVNSVHLYRYGNLHPALAYVNLRSTQAPPSVTLYCWKQWEGEKNLWLTSTLTLIVTTLIKWCLCQQLVAFSHTLILKIFWYFLFKSIFNTFSLCRVTLWLPQSIWIQQTLIS